MQPVPEFSSLLVSRPGPAMPLLLRARGFVFAIALYAAGLAALLSAPLFMLEMMKPPEAGLRDYVPATPLTFRTRGRKGGDGMPAAPGRRMVRSTLPKARQSHAPALSLEAPLSPPETDPATQGRPDDRTGGGGPADGDPSGGDGSDSGSPGGNCHGCIGTGMEGPGSGEDGPFQAWAAGLIPPRIIPSSRALPLYPDLARRAGLQGTVILLVVVEADGSVGEIEVIRSPDQRWGFDLAAIGAVKEWRYEPALMNDKPVAAYIQVMVEFALSR